MDVLQEYVLPLYVYLTSLAATIQPLLRALYFTLLRLYFAVLSNPDPRNVLVAVCVVITTFFAARTFLRYVFAQIQLMFWMAIYAGLVGVVVWLWARGPDGAVSDAQTLFGFWRQQYAYYEGGRRAYQQQYGGGYGYR